MAGNSRRRGAVRKPGTKKGPTVGSGGQRRRGVEGRGATPPAHMRPYHPAAKRLKAQQRRPAKRSDDDVETVLGRNPVLECLRAGVPATALYVALGTQADERLTESVTLAADSCIAGSRYSCRPTSTCIPTSCSRRPWIPRPHCWSRWTTSPIRATSVRSFG